MGGDDEYGSMKKSSVPNTDLRVLQIVGEGSEVYEKGRDYEDVADDSRTVALFALQKVS